VCTSACKNVFVRAYGTCTAPYRAALHCTVLICTVPYLTIMQRTYPYIAAANSLCTQRPAFPMLLLSLDMQERGGEERRREEKRRKEEGQWETIRKVLRRRKDEMKRKTVGNGGGGRE
jgi:hypothetical protein